MLSLQAPAKLNLGLRIVGVRDDGNHELESVFAPLELQDRVDLEIEPAQIPGVRLELRSDDPEVPEGPENLAARAAHAFLEAAALRLRVRIRLAKSIPAGAGLGGGSSDAGAVLRGLRELYPAAVPDLPRLALGLGADVPYFLDPRPAFVTGIGERCEPLPGLSAFWLVLLLPREKLATAAVYRAWDAECDGLTPRSAA
ncbi:MAG: 4-(cytidine 5'-diphospho)-2-C-methyl-D-erythritol kinase, partial [Myxococcota bacterium]